MYSPEENARIHAYRAKAAANTLTEEELRDAVALLRQARQSATVAAAKKRKAAAVSTRSAEDLLGELENLP